jgi:hypothetical protein
MGGPNRRPGGSGDGANLGNRPGSDRPNLGNRPGGDRPNLGNRPGNNDRPNLGNRPGDTNINIGGDVNVGNRVNYADNRQQWISQRNSWGNDVRNNVGNRYNNFFDSNWYAQPRTGGGYAYWNGWVGQSPYYAWQPAAWATFGAFLGGAWSSAQPVYYGYGQGGNVYYEDNSVYVNGTASGTPQEYYDKTQAIATAAPAPDQIKSDDEWLPLGVFAVTSEDTPDSSAVLQLAVDKQGVIAGTFVNEDAQINRPVRGTVDKESQRAVMTFGDGWETDIVLETGVYNLTQDEAPALVHFGADESQPLLLVRLNPPEEQE